MWEMSTTRAEKMGSRLKEMQASSPGIEASAVVPVEGLIMASALPANVEEDRISAIELLCYAWVIGFQVS